MPRSAAEVAAAGLPSMIERQAALAVEEADVVVFVVDGQVRRTLLLAVHTRKKCRGR